MAWLPPHDTTATLSLYRHGQLDLHWLDGPDGGFGSAGSGTDIPSGPSTPHAELHPTHPTPPPSTLQLHRVHTPRPPHLTLAPKCPTHAPLDATELPLGPRLRLPSRGNERETQAELGSSNSSCFSSSTSFSFIFPPLAQCLRSLSVPSSLHSISPSCLGAALLPPPRRDSTRLSQPCPTQPVLFCPSLSQPDWPDHCRFSLGPPSSSASCQDISVYVDSPRNPTRLPPAHAPIHRPKIRPDHCLSAPPTTLPIPHARTAHA
ncbi:hypothetical protein F5X68DRAFT_80341 [Plectosphaerella plurivora]|uniref:Uncharacterized protein n=1 Tax=Plectosphaerella plurivora TaxID=936078 RepID=A0A9P9ABW4_9PEZI|nr:hypothetical protein F5X68DRAFT_80341 [Plectosphaerella plurivora]